MNYIDLKWDILGFKKKKKKWGIQDFIICYIIKFVFKICGYAKYPFFFFVING